MLLVTGAQLTRMSGGGLALAGKGSSSGERGHQLHWRPWAKAHPLPQGDHQGKVTSGLEGRGLGVSGQH